MLLKDKVAIVTGGASGIGQAIVERFAREGARVVVADVNEAEGRKVAQSVAGGSFRVVDVTKPEAVEDLILDTVRRHLRLDILVNNAGIDGEVTSTLYYEPTEWSRVLQVNLNGVFYGAKYALEVMLRQKSGVILNMASVAGLVGTKHAPAYTASKSAIVGLTKSMALEVAEQGIRVNALCPAVTATPMMERMVAESAFPEALREEIVQSTPMRKLIPVEAVAAAAVFLCSAESEYITGVALPVDGGYLAK